MFHREGHSFHQLCTKELLVQTELYFTVHMPLGAETRSGPPVTKYLADDVIQKLLSFFCWEEEILEKIYSLVIIIGFLWKHWIQYII